MGRRTDMLFKHENSQTEASNAKSAVEETLHQICDTDDIRPESPHLYSQLVYQLRSLNHHDLNNIHNAVLKNKMCEKNHKNAV